MYLLYCRPIFLSRQCAKSSTVTMASNLGKKCSFRHFVVSSCHLVMPNTHLVMLLHYCVVLCSHFAVSSCHLVVSGFPLTVFLSFSSSPPAWSVNSRCTFIHLRPLPETASAACPRFLSQLSLTGFAYPHVLFNYSLPSLLVFLSFFSQVEFSPLD